MHNIPVPPAPNTILTIQQVAKWLQISVDQAKRLNLPAIRVGKNRWRYLADVVMTTLRQRQE